MRKEWFAFVKKTRRVLQRKNKGKNISHQAAMSEASKFWPKEKEKIKRRIKRQDKKKQKTTIQVPENNAETDS